MNRLFFAAVFVLLTSTCLMAQVYEFTQCSEETLRGPWATAESGWSPPITGSGGLVPFISWGRLHFDGRGAFTGKITANIGGGIFRGRFVDTAVKVNSDCTCRLDYTIESEDIPGLKFGSATGEYVVDVLGLEAVGSPNVPPEQPVATTIVLSKMKRIGPRYMK
jgi:hypothetical protein